MRTNTRSGSGASREQAEQQKTEEKIRGYDPQLEYYGQNKIFRAITPSISYTTEYDDVLEALNNHFPHDQEDIVCALFSSIVKEHIKREQNILDAISYAELD